ncbi:di/tricarboxylate transporter [Streptacidiphilus sp. MAP12-33]|uniref:SLC13 family permease n=1 Tax=Streptacidiphilus sp. MAP12-33 TaxID=3156266 RepID=UPI0035180ECC
MSHAAICLVVLGLVVVLFVWNRLPVELVALGSALALLATGILTTGQVFAGFGDPVVAFVAALFVVSTALQATGVTAWAGRALASVVGAGTRRLLVLTMTACGLLTALITVNGAVAALLPMTVLLAVRLRVPSSRLAMPLAFAAHAGSLLLLIGSPINVIVSEAASEAGARPFGFFEFALVGVPVLAGTIAVAVLLGPRLLPERTPDAIPADLSRHARTLIDHYALAEGSAAAQVTSASDGVGAPLDALAGQAPPGVLVVGAMTADGHDPRGTAPLEAGDIVVLRGEADEVAAFGRAHGLEPLPPPLHEHLADVLVNRDAGLVELVVSPRSALVGTTAFPGMASATGDLSVLAIHREGAEVGPEPTSLAAGDGLLLRGRWDELDRAARRRDVLVVDRPHEVRGQAAPLGRPALAALGVLAGMVVLLGTGAAAPAVAATLAALLLVALRTVTVPQAYAGISWTTLVIVGGMFPLSVAMKQSGAADDIADLVVSAASGNGRLLLLAVFLLTAVLGQFISNMATALIVTPVAVSAAQDAGVSVLPVLMCVAVPAAAALLTPVATAANMMVMGPGGYRFGDYWKFGLPIMGWYLVVAMSVVPLVWPL